MRNRIVDRIYSFASRRKDVFLVSGDAGFGVLDKYQTDFPKRFLNLGVAEQNAISFASGLALGGFRVFIYNIIPFLLYRCYEQVRNDICYQELPVTLIGIGSGVTYAPQGMTHYSVEDIALARTLPNLTVFSPADPLEAEACVDYAMHTKNPVYIRVSKSGEAVMHRAKPKDITLPLPIREGRSVAILFYGSISSEVIEAINSLTVSPMVISLPMLQPLNFAHLKGLIKNIRTIITVEEHFKDGGLASIISEWLVNEKKKIRLIRLGIDNQFIHH
ncbi:MAG: transketolase C-terminal domain-containing protein, partial [Candidatus Omnitrophica bacterium]|nr:transketolase C-terminal domain-containing protein [Candidatus Omnitrophota bacterium]